MSIKNYDLSKTHKALIKNNKITNIKDIKTEIKAHISELLSYFKQIQDQELLDTLNYIDYDPVHYLIANSPINRTKGYNIRTLQSTYKYSSLINIQDSQELDINLTGEPTYIICYIDDVIEVTTRYPNYSFNNKILLVGYNVHAPDLVVLTKIE